MILNEHERDAIGEAFNMGMGQAGNALSEMLGEEVLLSVPFVAISRRGEAAHKLCAEQETGQLTTISCVHQRFQGPFSGSALLLFAEGNSLELVRALLQQPDADLATLTEMEEEALVEVGNIILNACLATIADIIGGELINEIPEQLKGQPDAILDQCSDGGAQEYMMQLRVHFKVDQTHIAGNIAFIMDLESLAAFRNRLSDYFGLGAA